MPSSSAPSEPRRPLTADDTDLGDVVHLSSGGNVLVHSVRTGGVTRDVTVTRLAPHVPAFVPLTPAGLLETRSAGPGTVNGRFSGIGRGGSRIQ